MAKSRKSSAVSSDLVTLFGEPPRANAYPSSFVISVLLHTCVFSLLTVPLIQPQHIVERFPSDRFRVRYVDFHSTEPQARQAAGAGIRYPGPFKSSKADTRPTPRKLANGAQSGSTPGSPNVTRLTPKRMPAPQTLIQPAIAQLPTAPDKTSVPLVVRWTPEKTVPKKVVPAAPEPPSIALARPTLDMPIKEENLADLRISSSAFSTQGPAVQPSTTSPIVVHGPEEVQKVPETASKQPDPPTPGRVLSLSDQRVAEGKVAVPVASQTAKPNAGTLIPGQLAEPSPAGNGTSSTKIAGAGEGQGAGDRQGDKEDAAVKPGKPSELPGAGDQAAKSEKGDRGPAAADRGDKSPLPGHAGSQTASQANSATQNPAQTASQTGAVSGPAQGAGTGSGVSVSKATVHISLPKDGQFGVVVFGASIQDQYPETAEMWSGRLASTVYLHVGLAKSWILQYAMPRLAEAAGGHLEAPWPYEIARPNLDPGDVDSDAVILHGLVTKEGRFDQLEVVYPAQLAQATQWLAVLNQWQFRPAKVNGQAAPVEILLIIPDQSQ